MAEGFKCRYCGSEIGTDLVILEATTLAGRLWTLNTCGPCHLMLKAAVDLELAGGGPGGHVETQPAEPLRSPWRPDDDEFNADLATRWRRD